MAKYKDYYETLGVARDADEKEIKRAFRKLARQFHPDVNPGDSGAEERFKEINEAYQVLDDSEKRAEYDRVGTDSEGNILWPGSTRAQRSGQGKPINDLWQAILGDWGWEAHGPFHVDSFYYSKRTNNRESEEPRRREQRVETLVIPKYFVGLIRALYRIKAGADDELVVVSKEGVSRADSPIWRVRKEGIDIKIEVSTALVSLGESQYSHNELSRHFRWVDTSSDYCQRLYRRELGECVSLLRKLVFSTEAERNETLAEINEVSEEVSNSLNLGFIRESVRVIESRFFDETSIEDKDIYREGERLVIHEDDLALLTLITLSLEGRLQLDDSVFCIYRSIEGLGRVPFFNCHIEQGEIIRPIVAKGNPIYATKGEETKRVKVIGHIKLLISIARELSENGKFTESMQQRLIESSQNLIDYRLDTESNTVTVDVRRVEGGALGSIEALYNELVNRVEGTIKVYLVKFQERRWSPLDILQIVTFTGNLREIEEIRGITLERPPRIEGRYTGVEMGY